MKGRKTIALALAVTMLMSGVPTSTYAAENTLVKWTKLVGSTGTNSITMPASDSINSVETLIDGNLLVTGTFDGNKVTDIDGLKGKQDGFVAKYDRNGREIFTTFIGGSATDTLTDGIASNYGGYIAVGYSQSDDCDCLGLNNGGKDGLIVKLNESGKVEKTVTFGGSDADELKKIIHASDGGYIVVGYSNSNDGDLEKSGKTTTDRDGIVAKYDKELNLQWVTKVGGSEGASATKRMDELISVARCDSGYYAVGYANSDGDDLSGIHRGEKDVLLVKIGENGEKEWVKTYGGSQDDEATEIIMTSRSSDNGERLQREQTDAQSTMGIVITGVTSSKDGSFEKSKKTEIESSFIMNLDAEGNLIWEDTLECSGDNEAKGVQIAEEGFVVTGTFTMNDMDFSGQELNGKKNAYTSYYSFEGNRLNTNSFGGNDKEEVFGIETDAKGDFIVYGKTSSAKGFVSETKGKCDGFMTCLDEGEVKSYVTYKYLIPVEAWKLNADTASMMAPMLYKEAYIEKIGEEYQITFYLINANIMGTTVSSKTLGDVSFEKDGTLVDALVDEYNEKTQVKTVKISAETLENPIHIHIQDAMGDIRLAFDVEKLAETENPPYFAPVQITAPSFISEYKTNIGGSDYDYVNDTATLANGNVVIVGQTYSNDGDFDGKLKGGSSAFVLEYDKEHNVVGQMLLGGTQFDSVSYVSGISPTEDGGYYITGSYSETSSMEPTGDFEVLKTETSVHGLQDTFVARYDKNHQQLWIKGFSGSNYDQAKTIKTTADGGCIILIETNSFDGDMEGKNAGLFDLVIVKYDSQGNRQWAQFIDGVNIESSKLGIDILENGNYIVGGIFSSTNGVFSEVDRYGNLFDLFSCEISQDGEILKMKSYGGDNNDYFSQIIATEDGGFLMVGDTKSVSDTFEGCGSGYDNAYVLKCDKNFEKQWATVIKSSENSEAVSVIEIEDGYYVLGDTRGNDFDFESLGKGNMDTFLAKLDKAGKLLEVQTIGGSDADYSVKLSKINGYQLGILIYDESNDGDLENMNKGKFDGSYFVYSYKEKPKDDKPQQPSNPENSQKPGNSETPNGSQNPGSSLSPSTSTTSGTQGNLKDTDSFENSLNKENDSLAESLKTESKTDSKNTEYNKDTGEKDEIPETKAESVADDFSTAYLYVAAAIIGMLALAIVYKSVRKKEK